MSLLAQRGLCSRCEVSGGLQVQDGARAVVDELLAWLLDTVNGATLCKDV